MRSIFSILFFFPLLIHAQSSNFKGLYVDGFYQILGNPVKEDSLLNYAQSNGFNSLTLYNVHQVNFGSLAEKNKLAAFIKKARTNANMSRVGAAGEIADFFESFILPYNLSRSDTNERFNVFNFEFEFWVPASVDPGGYYCTTYLQPGGYSCDESGAFQFYMHELKIIDSITTQNQWESEIYLGWFSGNEANQMIDFADRVLLSNYNADPNQCFDNSLSRFQFLGFWAKPIKVATLFSAEPAFLQPWLLSHNADLDSAFHIFTAEYDALMEPWKLNVELVGQQWFTYSKMPYHIGSVGDENYSGISDIILFPNPTSNEIIINENGNQTSDNLSFSIFDFSGKKIISGKRNQSELFSIDVSHLESGMYLIKIGETTKRFVKW